MISQLLINSAIYMYYERPQRFGHAQRQSSVCRLMLVSIVSSSAITHARAPAAENVVCFQFRCLRFRAKMAITSKCSDNLLGQCQLWDENAKTHIQGDNLTGDLLSKLIMKRKNGKHFVYFPKIYVREQGRYRLKFILMVQNLEKALSSIFSKVITIYGAR